MKKLGAVREGVLRADRITWTGHVRDTVLFAILNEEWPVYGTGTAAMSKLYFYYAAMNAGKSTTLLQADFNYRERGMETMLWTASARRARRAGVIGSRIALSAPAHTYDENIDLFAAID